MEVDAILGFSCSLSMHGLRCNKLIGMLLGLVIMDFIFIRFVYYTQYNLLLGDGDNSVSKRLNQVLPYGNEFRVKKVECRNHLFRNYAMKLTALAKRTEYPIAIRKYITANIIRFRTDITKAIKHHLKTDSIIQQKTTSNFFKYNLGT